MALIKTNRNRHSGMELLRIIAMALVVLTHTDFWALGSPTAKMCSTDMVRAAYQYYVEFISIICVNCFVFISGWFSIKPSVRGFANLVFQILFYNLLIYLICAIAGFAPKGLQGFISHLNVFVHWFLTAYIALYLLSPILNLFIEHAGKRQAMVIVGLFVLLDILLGWAHDYLYFMGGYSLLHFMVIYLIARYIKVYGGKFFTLDKKWDATIYLLIALLTPTLLVLSYYVAPAIWRYYSLLFWYNNPLVMIMSVYFCLFFTKLNFKSRVVNFVAASSFAVYLIHTDTLVNSWCIRDFCRGIFFSHDLLYFSGALLLLIVALFVVAVILDQVRQILWSFINSRLFKDAA
ncbi:MAG: acyltransferase family protein [Muribaculaceae bacterium]|nr:acyltransferase family protein [Muribaculaceae bacterium]